MAIKFNKGFLKLLAIGIMLMTLGPFINHLIHLDYNERKESELEEQVSSGYYTRHRTTNTIILFRGVPETHPKSGYAVKGVAVPFGGHRDPIKHRDGNTKSIYTSWTTNVAIAFAYATTDQFGNKCSGDILVKSFEYSADVLIMMEDCGTGDIFKEDEYLVAGSIEGCIVIPVCYNGDWRSIERRLYNGDFGNYN